MLRYCYAAIAIIDAAMRVELHDIATYVDDIRQRCVMLRYMKLRAIDITRDDEH